MPTISGEGGVGLIDAAHGLDADGDSDGDSDGDGGGGGYSSVGDQLSDRLLTLSLVARTRWQTLVNLDAIRQRNKPKEAPRAPEKAPFFLPSLGKGGAGAGERAALAAASEAAAKQAEEAAALAADRDRIVRVDPNAATGESQFTVVLRSGDGEALLDHLKALPPSSADLEIRSLQDAELDWFVRALTERLRSRRDFELAMAWMNVFLKCHGDVVAGCDGGLRTALEDWRGALQREQGRLADRVGFCLGVAEFLRGR